MTEKEIIKLVAAVQDKLPKYKLNYVKEAADTCMYLNMTPDQVYDVTFMAKAVSKLRDGFETLTEVLTTVK